MFMFRTVGESKYKESFQILKENSMEIPVRCVTLSLLAAAASEEFQLEEHHGM